jgi:hypothetical protein
MKLPRSFRKSLFLLPFLLWPTFAPLFADSGPFPEGWQLRDGAIQETHASLGAVLALDGHHAWASFEASGDLTPPGTMRLSCRVALASWPWHEAPLLDALSEVGGFQWMIDAEGYQVVRLQQGGQVVELKSHDPLTLRRWHQLEALWDGESLALVMDGRRVGLEPHGLRLEAPAKEWICGKSRTQAKARGTLRPEASAEVPGFLDGRIAGLAWSAFTGSVAEESAVRELAQAIQLEDLPLRKLPSLKVPGPFGAVVTSLPFYPEWDAYWRSGPHADVVVRFEQLPVQLSFWRGTSYIPHWVSENGIWYTNEFNETWGHGIPGCGEPMSDKQCRYSRVAVVENGPARSVVHWRYALTDVYYEIARADPVSGWGDWTDEVHTVYPDGSSVREITLHTSQPEAPHEWHEGIVVMGPGVTPEDALEPEALSLWSPDGEKTTFDWRNAPLPWSPPSPAQVMLQRVHTRSRFQPYVALRPEDQGTFNLFAKEIRPDVSIFPWWNHWPTALNPCDGRYAFAADRPSHSSLNNLAWNPIESGEHWSRKVMLAGMTDASDAELLQVARAWTSPAVSTLAQGKSKPKSLSFSYSGKAWEGVLSANKSGPIRIALNASPAKPVRNPAWVLRNWQGGRAKVLLDGVRIDESPRCRQQTRLSPDGCDLILWIELASDQSHLIQLEPDTRDNYAN